MVAKSADMKFKHSVPILFSGNVATSINYYTEVLQFATKWTWDDPPSFGGVSKDGIEIFFCENGQGQPGTWLAVMVSDVDEYHDVIKTKGAHVLQAPVDREWGLREMLVEDPDKHVIRFGQSISLREKSELSMPSSIRMIQRKPTSFEYRQLLKSVKWNEPEDEHIIQKILEAPLFAVVAEDVSKNEAVGCALLLGDHVSFFYVKDVMVHPDWQKKRIGTAMMQEISDWLNKHAPHQSLVGLYTGENLAPFYRQFDFRPGFGMTRRINQRKGTREEV